jgi:hypothetical protein
MWNAGHSRRMVYGTNCPTQIVGSNPTGGMDVGSGLATGWSPSKEAKALVVYRVSPFHLVKSKIYEASPCTFFTNLPTFQPPPLQISPQRPILEHPKSMWLL